MKTRVVLAVFALALTAGGLEAQSPAGAAQPPSQPKGIILERVLVRVNGEIFTQSQLVQRQTEAIRARNIDPKTINDASVLRLLNDVTPEVLVDSIDEMLLVQRGRELGIKFSEEAFKDGIENIKKDNKLDDAGLKQVMKQEGMTMEQLRQNFEREYLKRQVQNEEIFRRMHVTEEELRQYYSSHKDQFTTPENVTLRELFVAAPAGAEDNVATKAKIDAIRARAVAGEDFVTLVKSMSDSPSKTNGGIIGPLNLEDINPTVKDVVANLKPGELSEPLVMPKGGYEIFKMESRETPVVQPFDKVKPAIEQRVRESRLDDETEKLLSRLRAQAVIEWKDPAYKQLYDQELTGTPAAK